MLGSCPLPGWMCTRELPHPARSRVVRWIASATRHRLPEVQGTLMLRATGVVRVNAAFLQEIKDENHRLKTLLDELHESTVKASTSRLEPERFSELTEDLRDQVALHFALEEAYGYFDDVSETTSKVTNAAELLRAEHGPLLREITEIAEIASQLIEGKLSPEAKDELFERALRYRASLLKHEAREIELIVADGRES